MPKSASPVRILVVDDTRANVRLLANLLDAKGYQVQFALSGAKAIEAAFSKPPDLILLDIQMPEMDGYETCRQLKANSVTQDIPVIFISALNEVLDKVKAFDVGGLDYITKPFQVEEVLARVETHLTLRQLQASLEEKNQQLEQRTNQLTETLDNLKATQEELIHSEKMAVLGQLVAGVAHEINSPLGAIRSSVSNMSRFLTVNMPELPKFFQQLPPEREQDFLALLAYSRQQNHIFTSRERRKIRRQLSRQLAEHHIVDADTIADTLVDIGVYDDITPLLPLLQAENTHHILQMAYQLATLERSTHTIATATDRAAKVVFALRSYARFDSSGEKLITNITEGIETVLTLYHNQLKQGIEVVRHYEPELPQIRCYPDELNQVWTNLIHNAMQAMQYQGRMNITVKSLKESESITHLVIMVSDTGSGINPNIREKIFEPFFTTKPPGEGSGLGLDIVKKIVMKHDGTIQVESEAGNTVFTITLPVH